MARSRKEWIGKNDDAKPTKAVRQRVYDKYEGMCHICGLHIKPTETWHADHVIAIIEGGPNRESNLKPAHVHCNLQKANGEKTRKAKVAKTRQKHLGIKNEPTLESRNTFDTQRRAERKAKASEKIQMPARRSIYRSA